MVDTSPESQTGLPSVMALCLLCSGIIHAAVIGVHADSRVMVYGFTVSAGIAVALAVGVSRRPSTAMVFLVAVVEAAMVAVYVASRTSGISFISALKAKEAVGFTDAVCTSFEVVALFAAILTLVGGARLGRMIGRSLVPAMALVAATIGVPAVAQAATHTHTHAGTASTTTGLSADGHDHTRDTTSTAPIDRLAPSTSTTTHVAAVVPPKPFVPGQPIDLSGVPGVTPEQQARAEQLLTYTLIVLPDKFSTPEKAVEAGFASIQDSATGDEHYINWDWIDDSHTLDPNYPESLVYRVDSNGGRTLEAAMFMLPTGTTLNQVPDVGGSLTQWHIHDNLCFTPPPSRVVIGVTSADGTCQQGVKFTPVPMMHVWVLSHPCGPFAALEGVGAGQIKAGETRACDHNHGASSTFG